ncbi:DUF2059 domain-containing protein [Aestuariivita boseongensis]|uniref:DUF2059 domain-containing protein n=1 Tax=Aestuariivita boseongensis TaxID=1470562 RepID=UPI000680DB5A|nr:DUF2059 domain-containing protein [Aestuariivita boseongensis]
MNLRALAAPVLAGAFAAVMALPAWADAARLAEVLKLGEVVDILHDEGMVYADTIEADMLPNGGGAFWTQTIARLYDRGAMTRALTDTLESDMSDAQIADSIAFFDTDQGQSILSFENAARAAMSDPEIEQIARAAYADLRADGDDRLDQIDRFVEANDLIERNVAGALSSQYQFFRGLADGGAFNMTDEDILADVYGQEPEIRTDTEEWLFGFLLMAYQPLSDEAMEAYIAFSGTDGGKALNAALFEGFERMYRDISFGLGLAASRAMTGSDL